MTAGKIREADERPNEKVFDIRFSVCNGATVDQDEEWCEVCVDEEWRRIRFHDYHEVYSIPGLYEQLLYNELRCDSPHTVCGLLNISSR